MQVRVLSTGPNKAGVMTVQKKGRDQEEDKFVEVATNEPGALLGSHAHVRNIDGGQVAGELADGSAVLSLGAGGLDLLADEDSGSSPRLLNGAIWFRLPAELPNNSAVFLAFACIGLGKMASMLYSSSGLGCNPLKVVTSVRIRYGVPN